MTPATLHLTDEEVTAITRLREIQTILAAAQPTDTGRRRALRRVADLLDVPYNVAVNAVSYYRRLGVPFRLFYGPGHGRTPKAVTARSEVERVLKTAYPRAVRWDSPVWADVPYCPATVRTTLGSHPDVRLVGKGMYRWKSPPKPADEPDAPEPT